MNKLIKHYSIIISAIFSFISLAHATNEITGKVVGITDGDTITVLQDKTHIKSVYMELTARKATRILEQRQNSSHQIWYMGNRSKWFRWILIENFGRTVGIVYINDLCVNEQIIKNGLAWVYQRYCDTPICKDWLKLEQQARNSKIGLWSHPNPIPPWDFRRGNKASSQPASTYDQSDVAGYHGNVNSKVFHQPTCKDYNCKNCTVVFKSREDAISQGYRPCGSCNP